MELLQKVRMEPFSNKVRRRRWRFIGYSFRQDTNTDCNVETT